MSYFCSDVKRLYKSKLVLLPLLVMGIVVVLDPIHMRFVRGNYPGFAYDIGINQFQFWLLMHSSGWGHSVYRTLMFLFPVLSTGMLFFFEQSTSVLPMKIARKSRWQYLWSKVGSVFFTTFFNFFCLFVLNLIVTGCCFSLDAPMTEQYHFCVPKAGSFAYGLYQLGPVVMEVAYGALNALAIALMAVIVIGIQMACKFRNFYLAFLVPYFLIRAGSYSEAFLLEPQYEFSIVIQPLAASALKVCITTSDLLVAFGILAAAAALAVLTGMYRSRDAL